MTGEWRTSLSIAASGKVPTFIRPHSTGAARNWRDREWLSAPPPRQSSATSLVVLLRNAMPTSRAHAWLRLRQSCSTARCRACRSRRGVSSGTRPVALPRSLLSRVAYLCLPSKPCACLYRYCVTIHSSPERASTMSNRYSIAGPSKSLRMVVWEFSLRSNDMACVVWRYAINHV